MYRRGLQGWLKHYDFIIYDLLCLQISFLLSYIARNGLTNPYASRLYCNMAIFIEIADLLVMFFFETFKNVLKRGVYRETVTTIQHVILVELLSVLYLFSLHEGQNYSRIVLYMTGLLYALLSLLVRLVWKRIVFTRKMKKEGKRSLLIVAESGRLQEAISNVRLKSLELYDIVGLVSIDCDMEGQKVGGIPVVGNLETCVLYACHNWVDEVLILPNFCGEYPQSLMRKFLEMGITTHVDLGAITKDTAGASFFEKIGNYTVFTSSINTMTSKQAFFKRAMDIVGGLLGCILTGILTIFIGPVIFISSPGPIFFQQTRIGKNGKKFEIYKFRSMYLDAEKRKNDLLKENKLEDSRMFKMDFDPRVIGNRVLPDGRRKTGIGNFIRVTSIDEFPQFLNVLKGDMSLVGTRPPTEDEWEHYELWHRARLSTKPGITGLWQVSGRSDITDFEEVVKLDTRYIREWSIALDLKIIFKTVRVVLKREGSA